MRWREVIIAGCVAAGLTLAVPQAYAQVDRPPELDMHYHRAEAAWRSGMSMLEAKARVDRVLEALPDDVAALKLRAQVLLAMSRYGEALSDARHAVRLASGDGEAHLILSEAARLSNDRALALKALEAAAEHVLDDPVLHIRLSWNAAELGQLEQAESYARIALALDPALPAAYYQLARVFVQRQNEEAAAEVLVRGLRRSVVDPVTIEQDPLLAPLLEVSSIQVLVNP